MDKVEQAVHMIIKERGNLIVADLIESLKADQRVSRLHFERNEYNPLICQTSEEKIYAYDLVINHLNKFL